MHLPALVAVMIAAGTPSFPGAPATPAGEQLSWLFDGMATRHAKFSEEELKAHFHPAFLAKVPPAQLLPGLAQVAAGELKIVAATEVGAEGVVARVTVDGHPLRVQLHIDAATKQIDGLLFQPDAPPGEKPKSWVEAEKLMAATAPHAQMLVAALEGGVCKPLHEVASSEELAIGSTFKLYVLLGLADRILAGKMKWDEQLAVRDAWKSLPSGVTQKDPAGAKLSVLTLAERMISISDNTAADHLLYTVGREQVEGAVRLSKHKTPLLDTPFLSTRELFALKLGPPEQADRYVRGSAAERRELLDKTLAAVKPPLEAASKWTTARRIDKVEWFASSADLCNAMAALKQRAEDAKAAPLLDVLAKNPGIPFDKQVWPYIGFKGGSEPGVINMTWLLRRDDKRWFVVSLGFNSDEGGKVDESKAVGIATGVIELLATERPAK